MCTYSVTICSVLVLPESVVGDTWGASPSRLVLSFDAAVLGDRLPEVTQKPFLGPGGLSYQ